LEDLVHDFLNKRGIPNWGRVGVSKGDIDIVIPDKLRNIVFIIEIKNPSGDYPFTPDDGGELVVRI
jgi:Holliday junction resolvase-like predicted endonuclease